MENQASCLLILAWMKHRAVLLLLVASLLGCGRNSVTGRVSYEGEPLEFGSVKILGSDGVACDGEISSDGTYAVDAVALGPAQVVVTCTNPQMPEQLLELARSGKGSDSEPTAAPSGELSLENFSAIPLEYGDFSKSGLSLTVERGVNHFDIQLQAIP